MKNLNHAEKESFLELSHEEETETLPFRYIQLFPENVIEKHEFFRVLDLFTTTFLFLLMYVGFWRGSFGIIYGAGFSMYQLGFLYLIGSFMTLYFMIMASSYEKQFKQKSLSNAVFQSIYIYTTEMGLILHWAGSWFVMEQVIDSQSLALFYSTTFSIVALFAMRSGLNTLTTPFKVICTNREFVRRLRSKKSPETVSKLIILCMPSALLNA